MNIFFELLHNFFHVEYVNTGFMILTSFIINILQTNGISYITAKIIDFANKNKKTLVLEFYKYFMSSKMGVLNVQRCKKYKKCIIIITHDRDVHSIFDETVNL